MTYSEFTKTGIIIDNKSFDLYHKGYDYTIYLNSNVNYLYGRYGFIKFDNNIGEVYSGSGMLEKLNETDTINRNKYTVAHAAIVALYSTPLGKNICIVTKDKYLYDFINNKKSSKNIRYITLSNGLIGRNVEAKYIHHSLNNRIIDLCGEISYRVPIHAVNRKV